MGQELHGCMAAVGVGRRNSHGTSWTGIGFGLTLYPLLNHVLFVLVHVTVDGSLLFQGQRVICARALVGWSGLALMGLEKLLVQPVLGWHWVNRLLPVASHFAVQWHLPLGFPGQAALAHVVEEAGVLRVDHRTTPT